MKNLTVKSDGSIDTVITYSADEIRSMKDDSDRKIVELSKMVTGERDLLATYEQNLAEEQANNDKLGSWLVQSNTAVAASVSLQANI